jgi:hypothetical protein
MRTIALLVTLAVTSVVAPGGVAAAHPFIAGGGRVPVQSLVTIALDLTHGCGAETGGDGPPTDEVALEVPTWLRVIDVPGPDGWDVRVEDGVGEALGVVVWTATTGAVPAPRFTLAVVIDGTAGETRYLRVSQRCGDRVERWVGSPDAPAAQPAVVLRLDPPDPARPAPPRPEPRPAGSLPEVAPIPAPSVVPVQPETADLTATSVAGRADRSRGTLVLGLLGLLGAGLAAGAGVVRARRR